MPILVVDDDPGTLRHVRDTLTEAGYAPLVTGDPRELSRILRTEKPRLVLPGTDGIQLMQTVPELADRAHGADPGGPAPAGRARPVRARGPGHRLRPAAGHRGRVPGGADAGDR